VLAFNGPKLSSFQSIGPRSPCNYLPPTTACAGGCSSQAVPGLCATSSHRMPWLFQQTSDAAAAAFLWACLRMVGAFTSDCLCKMLWGLGPLPSKRLVTWALARPSTSSSEMLVSLTFCLLVAQA
jgi:hypothetical protein